MKHRQDSPRVPVGGSIHWLEALAIADGMSQIVRTVVRRWNTVVTVETCRMPRVSEIQLVLTAAATVVMAMATACAQLPTDDEIPGAVRLKNGLILRGLCGSGQSLTVGQLTNSRLDLRKIDQGFRTYYVATRQSESIVPDNRVLPDRHFEIVQRGTGGKPLNFSIGLHQRKPFQPDGKSQVTLNLGGGKTQKIDIGIRGIDRRFAKVRGLSHRWMFGVSIHTIPDALFYSGIGRPGLLPSAEGFSDGRTRLRMIQMLMEAKKFSAAYLLAVDTATQFPVLKDLCDRQIEKWNDLVASAALEELQQMKDAGRYELAKRYARRWPDARLDAVIRVRAQQFLKGIEDEQSRVDTIARSLDQVHADIDDAQIRRQSMKLVTELKTELSVHTLPRFEAYEFLWKDEGLAARSKIALAVTGWLLGGKDAVDEFAEAEGLFQARYLIYDYLQSADDDVSVRDQLIAQIRSQEGFTVERAGLLLRNMSPQRSVRIADGSALLARPFSIEADDDVPRCAGFVPAEFSASRSYPLIIAFPRGGGSAEVTAALWRQQAERNGYLVAVPEIYLPTEGHYDATAKQHRLILNTITELKSAFNVDDERVFITGHGIGAEAAMDFATAHPDIFAGVVPIAGLGRKHLQWTIGNAPQLPWYVVSGTRQPFYGSRMMPVLNKLFTRVPSRGRNVYCNAMLAMYPERGFESYAEELPDILEWMNLQRRPQYSDRIDATTLRSTDQSWFWLELNKIEDKYIGLDDPSTPEDRPEHQGKVDAEINGNLIRVRSLPALAFLRLGPICPEIDLEQPIRISRSSRIQKIDYEPSLRDLLDDFRNRRDRSRPCFMKVPVD